MISKDHGHSDVRTPVNTATATITTTDQTRTLRGEIGSPPNLDCGQIWSQIRYFYLVNMYLEC